MRARILDDATRALAEPLGADSSMESIADAVGLSRSAMYNYFDGRADLVAAVVDHAGQLAADALGPWVPSADVPSFWAALSAASLRLRSLISERPEMRAHLAALPPREDDPWMDALVDNAAALRLYTGRDRPAAVVLTTALLGAVDRLELERPGRVSDADLAAMLAALWRTAP